MQEARTGTALIRATREYAKDDPSRSLFHVISTGLALVAAFLVAALGGEPWLRILGGVAAGLITVRAFIIYHDHQHHAILRDSKIIEGVMQLFGILVLAPSQVWKQTHNHHHTHNARLHGSHIGSFEVLTVGAWDRASFPRKLGYYMMRHPMTILAGYLTVFVGGFCVSPLMRNFKKHFDSLIALLVHIGLYVLVVNTAGWFAAICTITIPFSVASALGAYLFYIQHNFVGVRYLARDEWTYAEAACDSSSYLKAGPVLRWITGNIGFHHIHHLNPLIPFYKLPVVMREVPELSNPIETSLHPREIYACLRLDLWSTAKGRMVSYREARRERREAAAAAVASHDSVSTTESTVVKTAFGSTAAQEAS
ncbi:MAG: fatty acid desaturase [Planctomycetota bacterium]